MRKTGGSACGAIKVTYVVAPASLVTCPGASPDSVNTEPAGSPGPYVVGLQCEFQSVTEPDCTAMSAMPG
jgi:hypothetical protein